MKRILVINTVRFKFNGITSTIVNSYSRFDSKKYVIDYLITNPDYDENVLEKLKNSNSNFYFLNRKRIMSYLVGLTHLIQSNKYHAVHVNGNSATMALEMTVALYKKIPLRLAHCHTSKTEHPMINKLLLPAFRHSYTHALACSHQAGQWLFEEHFIELPNGIDAEKYYYAEECRAAVRKKFALEDRFVIGHIGVFHESKNHKMLFAVTKEILKRSYNAHLLLVTGTDDLPKNIEELISEFGLDNRVTILHKRNDVPSLIQAMDCFVFPSKWEGFGLAVLEAQAGDLPCYVSDKVSREVAVSDCVNFISLDESPRRWAEVICNSALTYDRYRHRGYEKVKKSKYNIANTIEVLEKIYDEK